MKAKLYFLILLHSLLILIFGKLSAQFSPPWTWAKTLSSTGGIYGKGLTIDRSGDRSRTIYVAGGFDGTVDFDPGPGTFKLSSESGLSAFVSKIDESGNYLWTKALLGTGGVSYAGHITIDPADGSIYTTGRFLGTIDFDPGEGIYTITSRTTNCTQFPYCGDNFISKLDFDGHFLWAKAIWGTEDVFTSSVAIDPGVNGDVYTTGYFRGRVDFDPGPNTFNLYSSNGTNDIFILKLNRSGDFQWAKQMGGQGNDFSYSIAMDPKGSGEIYTTGYFESTVDFNPGKDTFNLTSLPISTFISKLDSAGNFKWAKQMGRAGIIDLTRIGSVALDPDGNGDVYTTGGFQGIGDFNPGEDTFTLASAGGVDIFISKLNSTGNFSWAKRMGGTHQDYGSALAIQPGGNGDIYIIGRFKGSADFDPGVDSLKLTSAGDYDIFISKLDSSGNFQWVKAIQGVAEEYISDIALDQKSLYLAGYFHSSSVSFDSTSIPNINTQDTFADLFIARLDIDLILSIAEIKKHTINLYPNPATNELTIEIQRDNFQNVGIKMYNILGEVVFSSPEQYSFHKKTIDISMLTAGVYFMETNVDGERVMKKFVKE